MTTINPDDVKTLQVRYQISHSQAQALWLLSEVILVTREDIEELYQIYGSAKQLMWNLRQALVKVNHTPEMAVPIKSKGYTGWWLDPEDQEKVRAVMKLEHNPNR